MVKAELQKDTVYLLHTLLLRVWTFVRAVAGNGRTSQPLPSSRHWAEARIKIARMTLTIKLDGNWSSFQLANNTPPLSVTGSVIAPSARMTEQDQLLLGRTASRRSCSLRRRLASRKVIDGHHNSFFKVTRQLPGELTWLV